MNEDELKQRIFTYVKKHNEELKQETSIEQLTLFLFEVYKSIPENEPNSNKISYILEQLKDDEEPDTNQFTTSDINQYISRLVRFVEQMEDPLEKNNLKEDSSAHSSDDHDEKPGALNLQFNRRHDDKKQKKSKRQNNNSQSHGRNKTGPPPNQILISLIQQMQQNLNPSGPNNYNFNSLLKQLQPQGQGYRPNTMNQHRKDNQVFLLNLPQDQKSFREIETMFAGKGNIQKIILEVKIPCVQFSNPQDAQRLLNVEKFIIHKGAKIELSPTPYIRKDRPNKPYQRADSKDEQEGQKKVKLDEPEVSEAISLSKVQSQQQVQTSQASVAVDHTKEEKIQQKQIEQWKSTLVALISERLRTILYLSKRNYDESVTHEIEQLKQELKQKKDQVKGYTNLELIKSEFNAYSEKLNHTLVVKELPVELIQNKTIMKELNDTYSIYGKIDTLQCQLKERSALIKFISLESAEKAYFDVNQKYSLEFQYQGIQKFIKQQ